LRTKEIKLDSGQRIVTFEIVAKSISLILRPNKNLD